MSTTWEPARMYEGRSITIRPLEPTDSEDVTSINNDPVVRQNVVGWAPLQSHASQLAWTSTAGASDQATNRFAVCTRSGTMVGIVGLWTIDHFNKTAEVGIKLGGDPSARGHGFGTDALMLISAVAFIDYGLAKLTARVLSTNDRSIHTFESSCGWTPEGRQYNQVFRMGSRADLVLLGLCYGQYEALPHAVGYIDSVRNGRFA